MLFSKRRNKEAALKFIKKAMKHNGLPEVIMTDRLASYKAAFKDIGIEDRQQTGCRLNNRCENSHLPFRRRERAMQRFKTMLMLQKFTHIQGQIYNHFNHERHLISRQTYKQKRMTALHEWYNLELA